MLFGLGDGFLADAEHDGALCRNKSSAGLAFYPNAFATRGVVVV